MCMQNGINWILNVVGKTVVTNFIEDRDVAKLKKAGKGITGHSVIREEKHIEGLEIGKGECGDFSSPSNFDDAIIAAVKAGKMDAVVAEICTMDQILPLLSKKTVDEYDIASTDDVMTLYADKKNRSKIWA
jgi:hypothetical protein